MPPQSQETTEENIRPETQLALLLTEGIKRKGLTIQKLSEVSGIASKHLEHMSGGNSEQFPPAPYLRSYLMILGRILDFDGRLLWERIKVDELAVHSGKDDRLTSRRRTVSVRSKVIWFGIVGLILGIYLLFQLPQIIGKPTLAIAFPIDDVTTTTISPVTITGSVENGDEFFINDERVPIGSDGLWQKNIDLQEGMNTIELRAQKFLGQDVRILKQIIYTPSASSSIKNTVTSSTTENASTTATSSEIKSSTTTKETKKKTSQ